MLPSSRKILVAQVWLCLLLWMQASARGGQPEMLEQAIQTYSTAMDLKQRDQRLEYFSRAEQLFAQAIETQRSQGRQPNAELLTNLGNAALQAGHVGAAIVAYRQALLVDPDHAQASQNLDYARSTLPDWVQRSNTTALVETLFFWRGLLSKNQIIGISALSFFIAAALLACSIVFQAPMIRNLSWLPLLVWFMLGISIWWDDGQAAITAVVVADDALVYSADSENSPPRIAEPLPDGTELRLIGSRDRWAEVQIAGRTGWVRSYAISKIDF